MDKLEFHTRRGAPAGMSKGFRRACGAVFVVVLFALLGCLDIPDEPEIGLELERIDVFVFQEGNLDSTLLKIRPNDSSVLSAATYPRQLKNQLTFHWLYKSGDSTTVLGEGLEYPIPAYSETEDIPNAIEVTDEVGNSAMLEFEIVVNMRPKLDTETIPADGDTIYGNEHSSVRFAWKSSDSDSFDWRLLDHTLIIDDIPYGVGRLTEIMQSGFKPGEHKFQVIVQDSFGDADTLPEKKFFMVDTIGGEQ